VRPPGAALKREFVYDSAFFNLTRLLAVGELDSGGGVAV
jgi:hypothetical protein